MAGAAPNHEFASRRARLAFSLTRLGAGALLAAVTSACSAEEAAPAAASDVVVFNDNGGWCWYQDERVIFDPRAGALLIGSVASAKGPGGKTRGGDVDLVSYDVDTGEKTRVTLDHIGRDDHNAPALLLRQDGRYLAMYTNHNRDRLSRYRISSAPHYAEGWGPKLTFDWRAEIGSNFNTTYSNLFYLSAEGRTYDFARADGRSPNMLVSDDDGETWRHAGRLTESKNLGYVNGYFKYASLGVDRIDFIATEHHPRDYDTSVYHGYLQGGKLHRSDGTVIDEDAFDGDAPVPSAFTPVLTAGATIGGETLTHAWIAALRIDAKGQPHAILTARANDAPENTNFDDHRFVYARFDGADWHVHPLAQAGAALYDDEEDYTGLGALDPHDAGRLYISTAIDPRNGVTTKKHEIYRGETTDDGATWEWTAITESSDVDNLRPVVPAWDGKRTALLWLRGTYFSMNSYELAVVGIIR
ncbi:Hypothetical protein A7982_07572 [Minicystis rosea]|nr:Hypothetical protein A7982_07572 [Minicystis rosea]